MKITEQEKKVESSTIKPYYRTKLTFSDLTFLLYRETAFSNLSDRDCTSGHTNTHDTENIIAKLI